MVPASRREKNPWFNRQPASASVIATLSHTISYDDGKSNFDLPPRHVDGDDRDKWFFNPSFVGSITLHHYFVWIAFSPRK
jgi:hypothetical protein